MSNSVTVRLGSEPVKVVLGGGADQATAAAAELVGELVAWDADKEAVTLGPDETKEFWLFGSCWARHLGFGDVVIGENAGNRNTTRGAGVIIGYEAGVAATSALDERQVMIGYLVGNEAVQNRAFVAIGDRAAQYAYNTIDCTIVGSEAGRMLGRLEPPIYDVPRDEAHILAAGADVTHGGSLPAIGLVGCSFFGKNSGRYNTIGLNNTGFGDSTLGFTTVGQQNVAIGYVCGEGNVTGSYNVFAGAGVRVYCYSGDRNVLLGYAVQGGVGDIGTGSSTDGEKNVQPGGDENAVVGTEGTFVWGGGAVAGLGYRVFYNLAAGDGGDVGLGHRAGYSVVTGGNNVFIGAGSGEHGSQATAVLNSIAIGAGTFTTRDDEIVIGTSDQTHITIAGVEFTRDQIAALLALVT
jgi:hypothetical protein